MNYLVKTLQVPNNLPQAYRYTILIHGLQGLYFGDHAEVLYDSGDIKEHYSVQVQTDKSVYQPGQTGSILCIWYCFCKNTSVRISSVRP